MTKDLFKVEFKRLCEGFDYTPRGTQVDAFYERLQHCDERDWREAVTDLLCSPRFPMNLEMILKVVDERAEQRRRSSVARDRYEATRICGTLASGGFPSMREALQDRPDLQEKLKNVMNFKEAV